MRKGTVIFPDEIQAIVAHWKAKRRYVSNRQTLIIFRLACCCGLRAEELSLLTLADVRTDADWPHIAIHAETSKGKKARTVPLWWDADSPGPW